MLFLPSHLPLLACTVGHVSFWGHNPIPALVGAWALWAVSTVNYTYNTLVYAVCCIMYAHVESNDAIKP